MRAERKLLISMLAIVFVLLAVVATIAIAFALTQQTITTTLNIGYVVEDIDGTASATYTIGGVTESLTAKKGNQVIGDTLVFHAGDTEDAGNLMFPEGQIPLSAQNDNIVIQYTYSNTGERHYIASMSFDGNISADNMKVEYSINGTDYSTNRYAVVVPANTANRSYWIKISIENKAKSASFTGDFNWLLSGCDPQEDSYLSLTSVEFQGSNGSYSASLANTGSYVGELVFPREVNGDPVTLIGGREPWEEGSLTQAQKNQITSVYIPDSVTTIGYYAFQFYTNLQKVTFEQNETDSASVSSTTGLTTINDFAFEECRKLTSIVLPDTLQKINSWGFTGCSGLQNLTLGDGIKYIGEYAFDRISVRELLIPASVTTIGEGAFSSCLELISIKVLEGNSVYHSAGNCVIETASKTLIFGCKTSVMPTDGSVTSIGASAFVDCDLLTSIVIPGCVISIGGWAFAGCTGLTSIEIAASVTSMGDAVFYNCSNLKNITTHTLNSSVVTAINELANENGEMNLTIGDNITNIPDSTFSCIEGLTSLVLGSGLTTIGEWAFDCNSLTELVIPEGVVSIGHGAFISDSLRTVYIPSTVTYIGNCAFGPVNESDNVTAVVFADPDTWTAEISDWIYEDRLEWWDPEVDGEMIMSKTFTSQELSDPSVAAELTNAYWGYDWIKV